MMRRGGFGLLPPLLLLSGLAVAQAPLRGPVDLTIASSLAQSFSAPLKTPACPVPPPAVQNITAKAFYSDGASSIENPEIVKANRDSLRPLNTFAALIQSQTETAMRDPSSGAAACALALLAAWARDQALLGVMDEPRQAGFQRKWMIIALGLPYSALRELPAGCPAHADLCASIGAWFGQLGQTIPPDYSPERKAAPKNTSARNNHQNWAGAAAVLAAVAADDRALYAWAGDRFSDGVAEIQPDGSLPLELARGRRALHYHAFALDPLLIIAATRARNGDPLSPGAKDALARLAHRLRDDLQAPASLAARVGSEQEPLTEADGRFKADKIAWAETWVRLTGDASVRPLLDPARPIKLTAFGGNRTVLLGVP